MRKSIDILIENLNAWVKKFETTQAEIAKKGGPKQNAVSLYLAGKKKPSLLVLDKFARALGTNPWDLLKPDAIKDAEPPARARVIARIREVPDSLLPDLEQSVGLFIDGLLAHAAKEEDSGPPQSKGA